MQWRTMWSRGLVVVALGVLVAISTGCNGPQLEERNLALQKQLDQALKENADLQAKNGTLTDQKTALAADLEKTRAELAAKTGGPAPKAPKTKPEFPGGVTTEMVGGALRVTMPEAVLFESGKADLLPASKKVLDTIAAVLNRDYARDKIRVEGHTDNQPIKATSKVWEDNWELAFARARSVLLYLVSKGVDPKRASAAAYSFYAPVAVNDTAAGRAKNRRVVITVYPQGTP